MEENWVFMVFRATIISLILDVNAYSIIMRIIVTMPRLTMPIRRMAVTRLATRTLIALRISIALRKSSVA